ncbi:MAG TPA: serine/threonine protein kinase, partial [Planctomycetes bacterium]|nr:serine/threonine protein kinase [Planctomycetota bacterium]
MSFDWSASDSVFQPTQGPLEKLGVERLGPYVLEGQVGAGGMGVVYRARDTNLDRPVAIKLLIAGRSAGLAQRKRMQREAQTLARLRHPGLLGVHASGEVEGCPYLVTEWLEGEPLDERLKREGGLPIDEAIEITLAVGRAVAHAHERGILHRDIKPSNVVQAGGRGPVLIDFGL